MKIKVRNRKFLAKRDYMGAAKLVAQLKPKDSKEVAATWQVSKPAVKFHTGLRDGYCHPDSLNHPQIALHGIEKSKKRQILKMCCDGQRCSDQPRLLWHVNSLPSFSTCRQISLYIPDTHGYKCSPTLQPLYKIVCCLHLERLYAHWPVCFWVISR